MNMMPRRRALAALGAVAAGFLTRDTTKAQLTEQQVRNHSQVTSTGNVWVDQTADGAQNTEIFVDGVWTGEDGIYRTSTGQIVLNDNQVTSTGDVAVRQVARGSQNTTAAVIGNDNCDPQYGPCGGANANCQPGSVLADPGTGQLFYCAGDQAFYPVPCQRCGK